jgi:DNA-directed RNA polymerase subunit RPC12/RpoP
MEDRKRIFYDNYKCQYCKTEFKFRSGGFVFIDKKEVLVKNKVVCPNCGNGLKNKASE